MSSETVVEGMWTNEGEHIIRIKKGDRNGEMYYGKDAKELFDLFYAVLPSRTFNLLRDKMNSVNK